MTDQVKEAIKKLKEIGPMSPVYKKRRSRRRQALRTPYKDGVRDALEAVKEYERELAKIR
jgi:hypothetical protein